MTSLQKLREIYIPLGLLLTNLLYSDPICLFYYVHNPLTLKNPCQLHLDNYLLTFFPALTVPTCPGR